LFDAACRDAREDNTNPRAAPDDARRRSSWS
jgi:hypothetical protein